MCPGAIVIVGRNRQMLAAALLNQSVSRPQSSPAIEHQRTQYKAALSSGFVPEAAIAGIGRQRINPARAGCFCLLSPPDSNSRGGGTAAIAGTTHGDEWWLTITACGAHDAQPSACRPTTPITRPRENARMRKGDVFVHRDESDCSMQALWTQGMPWLARGSPAQLGGDQAALHQATGERVMSPGLEPDSSMS